MKILITGAGGFIGGHLIKALQPYGYQIFALVRRDMPAWSTPNINSINCQMITCDLNNHFESHLPDKINAIIHLAQANVAFPHQANELYRINTVVTQQLLDYGRKAECSAFIYASSGSVYHSNDNQKLLETSPLNLSNFYSLTRIHGEQLVSAYNSYYETTVSLRLFAPYGPNQTGRMIPNIIERVKLGKPVSLNIGAHPYITPTFITDINKIFISALPLKGKHIFNVSGCESVNIEDIAMKAGKYLGKEPIFERTQNISSNFIADNQMMRTLLNMSEDTVTSFDAGLQQIIWGANN